MYRVIFLNLPTTVHSFVRFKDGFATIVINARMSSQMQKECFKHEINHLRENDFDLDDADVVETLAHWKGTNHETDSNIYAGIFSGTG